MWVCIATYLSLVFGWCAVDYSTSLIAGQKDSMFEVIFVDYGNLGLANSEDLLELNDKTLLSFPPLV